MRLFYAVFAIISGISAIAVIVYVCIDIYLEKRRKSSDAVQEDLPNDEIIREDEPIPPAVVEVMPEPVEEIDVESADRLISDKLALSAVTYGEGAGVGLRGFVNVGKIDGAFERGEVVTIDALKERGLLSPRAGRVKILADGTLHKPLTVKAEAFSVQAVKMIELTGGTVVILKS